MKKGWKIFWIVCAAMTVTGFICCTVAAGLGVSSEMIRSKLPRGVGYVESHEYTEKEDDIEDTEDTEDDLPMADDIHEEWTDIHEISADIFAGEVHVVASDSDKIRVETSGISQSLGLRCYVEERELKIETKDDLWGVTGKVGEITIYIPKEYQLNEASFDIGAGTLTIDSIRCNDLGVEVGAGKATINDFKAHEASFSCGAGKISATGTAEHEADFDCDVGEINATLAGSQKDYNLEVDCGMGKVTCGDYKISGVKKEYWEDNGSAKEISIDCSVGKVDVQFNQI